MRRLGKFGTAVLFAGLFVGSAVGFGFAAARAADPGSEAREAGPWGAEVTAPVALMSRLHHAAEREVQLGELAEAGGSSAASQRYGAELTADFRELDQRIVATAASVGIDDARLSAVEAGENVVALKKETDDLGRLANERGAPFDRDFWVTVAEAQSAESDMLTVTAVREPALLGIVTEMSKLYERSSKRALAAASGAPPSVEPSAVPGEAPAEPPVAQPPGR
jgi:Spy/CpxP family protein refolding chaperone